MVHTFNQYTHLPVRVLLAKALIQKQFSGKYEAVSKLEDVEKYQEGDKKIPFYLNQEIKGRELENIKYKKNMV